MRDAVIGTCPSISRAKLYMASGGQRAEEWRAFCGENQNNVLQLSVMKVHVCSKSGEAAPNALSGAGCLIVNEMALNLSNINLPKLCAKSIKL